MKSGWIVYKNRRILLADYSEYILDSDGIMEEIAEVNSLALKERTDSVLLLVYVENSVGSKEILSCLKDSAFTIKNNVYKTAVVGVTGAKSVLMKMISNYSGLKMKAFDDTDAAKDWLIAG